jgi:uncharacterized protein (TIGR02453 family)
MIPALISTRAHIMQGSFNGFSSQSLQFLTQVRQENSKEWFDAHRDIYDQTLREPFQALVETLTTPMLLIDDLFEVRPMVGKTISRIYRDTRFSRDKSRYRSNMWLMFKRYKKDWIDAPSYFFELHADGWRFGLGYYSATRTTMALFRQSVQQDPSRFLEVANCLGSTFELHGERYKRSQIKGQAEALAHWCDRKSFAVIADRHDMSTAFDRGLATKLAQGFDQLAPLYHYLMRIEAEKRAAAPMS